MFVKLPICFFPNLVTAFINYPAEHIVMGDSFLEKHN